MRVSSLVISTSMFLIISCGADDPVMSETGDVLVPLAVGNRWEYQRDLFIDYEFPEGFEDSTIVEIIGEEYVLFEDKEYQVFLQNTRTTPSEFSDGWGYTNRVRNDDKGMLVLRMNQDSTEYDRMHRTFRYPVSKGEKWSFEATINDTTSWTVFYECVNIDTLISTPAGEFSCYHYQIRNELDLSVSESHFFVPGIGEISTQSSSTNWADTSRILLVGYNLN